jgi:hypothetical protein
MNVYTLNGATLAPGPDFTTTEQRIDTPEEAEAFGAQIGSFVSQEIQHAYASLDGLSDDLLARWKIVRAVEPDPPAPPVAEVPMYRVKIVLAQQGMTAGVTSYIAGLSEPEKTIAQTLWDSAPNLVVQGAFALQVKAAMGLSDAQYEALINAALGLTL